MKIVNPWPDADKSRVNADLDPAVFNYFFRGALAGERGPREAMICIFFKALYEECIKQQIPAHFEIDNEHRIAQLLQGITFGSRELIGKLTDDLIAAEQRIRDLESRLSSANSPSSGPPLNPDKPTTRSRNGKGRVAKVRSVTSEPGSVSSDAGSKT